MPRVSLQYEQAQQKRIIDGAAQVFAAHGYGLTTIDQISQSLQLSKGAIYIYFKNKEELFVSVLEAIYERRFTILSTAYCKPSKPNLTNIFAIYFTVFFRKDSSLVR